MNRKIELVKATEAELRQFARDNLGLNMPPNAKIETLRAKITAAWDKDHILLPEAEDTTGQVGDAPQPVTAEQQVQPDKVRIIIQMTEDESGNDPVPVGVNGSIMLIPRGEEVDIPFAYFEVLQHAVTHKYDPMPGGGINPVPRKVPLYPFQRVA